MTSSKWRKQLSRIAQELESTQYHADMKMAKNKLWHYGVFSGVQIADAEDMLYCKGMIKFCDDDDCVIITSKGLAFLGY